MISLFYLISLAIIAYHHSICQLLWTVLPIAHSVKPKYPGKPTNFGRCNVKLK